MHSTCVDFHAFQSKPLPGRYPDFDEGCADHRCAHTIIPVRVRQSTEASIASRHSASKREENWAASAVSLSLISVLIDAVTTDNLIDSRIEEYKDSQLTKLQKQIDLDLNPDHRAHLTADRLVNYYIMLKMIRSHKNPLGETLLKQLLELMNAPDYRDDPKIRVQL